MRAAVQQLNDLSLGRRGISPSLDAMMPYLADAAAAVQHRHEVIGRIVQTKELIAGSILQDVPRAAAEMLPVHLDGGKQPRRQLGNAVPGLAECRALNRHGPPPLQPKCHAQPIGEAMKRHPKVVLFSGRYLAMPSIPAASRHAVQQTRAHLEHVLAVHHLGDGMDAFDLEPDSLIGMADGRQLARLSDAHGGDGFFGNIQFGPQLLDPGDFEQNLPGFDRCADLPFEVL